MAEKVGIKIAPHSPNSGEEAYPMLHFASLTPNIYNFMEYKIGSKVKDGRVKVPQEPGLGKLENEDKFFGELHPHFHVFCGQHHL